MISHELWQILVRQLWQFSVVALAVGVVARVCRRRPHVVYVLWALVLVKSLTPPIWSSPTGVFSWVGMHRAEVAAAPLGQDAGAQWVAPGAAVTTSHGDVAARVGAALMPADLPQGISWHWWQVLVGIWAAGAGVTALIVGRHFRVLRGRIERSSVRPPREIANIVRELRQTLGLRRDVRLVVCGGGIGPAVFGIVRPVLVIPAAIVRDKTLAEIRTVLAHEMIHVRRGDSLAAGVQLLSQVIWWFHPLAWWMNRQMSRVRELCCDAEVLTTLRCSPADYAQMLINVLWVRWRSERAALAPWPMAPLSIALGIHPVQITQQRLEQIMTGARWGGWRSNVRHWLLVGLCALAVLPGAGIMLGMDAPEATAAPQSSSGPTSEGVSNWSGWPRLSPFEAVRWQGQVPQVQVNGNWYELLAINDVPRDQILVCSFTMGPTLWQKHFEEDLVQVMSYMGHAPGATVTLKVMDLKTNAVETLQNVSMTGQNRQALFTARAAGAMLHFVRIVVSGGAITYEGKPIDLAQLPAKLEEVPDAEHTVVEIAVASDDVTTGQFDKVQAAAAREVSRLRFKYLSYIGKQDASSTGSPDQLKLSPDPAFVAPPGAMLPALVPVPDSELTHIVPIEIGKTSFALGDEIAISEVRGTSSRIQVDGTYQVTGTYTLGSRDKATLALSVSSKNPQNAFGAWSKLQQITVTKGTGTFTLTERMAVEGFPHISFYDDRSALGGMYFGTGDWVQK